MAGTIGLLLFMYLLHQLLLFAAALAATDTRGTCKDLAGGEIPRDLRAIAESAEHAAELVEEAAESTERAAKSVASSHSSAASGPEPS